MRFWENGRAGEIRISPRLFVSDKSIVPYRVNRKRVRRLLRMMGLEAMRPKSGALSAANRAHPVFP